MTFQQNQLFGLIADSSFPIPITMANIVNPIYSHSPKYISLIFRSPIKLLLLIQICITSRKIHYHYIVLYLKNKI